MPSPHEALRGRKKPTAVSPRHFVNGHSTVEPFPGGFQLAMFAMGCFWGAERMFWSIDGVYSTQAGFSGGFTPHPTYKEVCTGMTGHAEVVRVVFDSAKVRYETLLRAFWNNHDPTTAMRQGEDIGTQYRSAIYVYDAQQRRLAVAAKAALGAALAGGSSAVTTEIRDAQAFYYAEDEHQQYLAKNTGARCDLARGACAAVPARA
ncbi:MAG: peptide-methionine (S)-S-oxide reductase MsrA [Rhodospirillaceae bacterium]|nr:peptide-methionine (S)-S-oxide reductase MsrA [Rhodospirillaceae bacterium]